MLWNNGSSKVNRYLSRYARRVIKITRMIEMMGTGEQIVKMQQCKGDKEQGAVNGVKSDKKRL